MFKSLNIANVEPKQMFRWYFAITSESRSSYPFWYVATKITFTDGTWIAAV